MKDKKNLDSDALEKSDNEKSSQDLPPEVTEVLESIPDDQRRLVTGMFMSMRSGRSSPIEKQINSSHIDKYLDYSDKDSSRLFWLKLFAIGSGLLLILIVLVYSAMTKETVLSEKVIIAVLSFLGGLGSSNFLKSN